jgi:hypothetical protein
MRRYSEAVKADVRRRMSHVLKPPDVLIRGVTTFLKPGGHSTWRMEKQYLFQA